jgi:hypothetical protein
MSGTTAVLPLAETMGTTKRAELSLQGLVKSRRPNHREDGE